MMRNERAYRVDFDLVGTDGFEAYWYTEWFVYVLARNQKEAKEKAKSLWLKDPIKGKIDGYNTDRMINLTARKTKYPNPPIEIFIAKDIRPVGFKRDISERIYEKAVDMWRLWR